MTSFIRGRNSRNAIALLVFAVIGSWTWYGAARPGKLQVASQDMKKDFESEVKRRRIQKDYQHYRQFVADKIASTRSVDKCRLSWVEGIILEPLDASWKAETFTKALYSAVSRHELPAMFEQAGSKLDINITDSIKIEHQQDVLLDLDHAIHTARNSIEKAFVSLSTAEQNELREKLYLQTTEEATLGYRFGGEDRGRRLIDLLLRVNRSELLNAAIALAPLTEVRYLDRLKGSVSTKNQPANILVGDEKNNTYSLDELDVSAIIDPGGDDTYIGGTTSVSRPVLVIIDLAGNDIYRGSGPAIQGSAIMGASLLLDLSGNDKYTATDVAQGSALAGVGLLIDHEGDDSYVGDRRVQGHAISGFGILIDRSGDDTYRGALLAQGVGGPHGFGLLADQKGHDHYFAGGKYEDSYNDSPGFGAWSQGIGVGARDVASGGIGVMLDGAGNDVYEADYFSHGGGYWYAAGFARDFGGDDRRLGAVRTNFDGSPRSEEKFLRWGIAFGCHYAAGFVFDDQGNDSYQGDWASIAYGWDVGIGALYDGDGNDNYHSRGSGVAEAHNTGFAILTDLRGMDRYIGDGLGRAERKINSDAFSFAWLQDRSGKDTFSLPLKNHSKVTRGWAGGFFIDR